MGAEGARFLHAPVKWGGVTIDTGELREPVSELGIADHKLYQRLLTGEVTIPLQPSLLDENVELGRE